MKVDKSRLVTEEPKRRVSRHIPAAAAVCLSGVLCISGIALSSRADAPIRAGASDGNEITLIPIEEEVFVQEITADEFSDCFVTDTEIPAQEENIQTPSKEPVPEKEEEEEEVSDLLVANVDGQLNVRSEPREDGEIVGILYQDCAGTLVSEEGDWVQLVSGDVVGWARKKDFLFGEEAKARAEETGVLTATVNTSSLYLRSGPDSEASSLGIIYDGEEAVVLSENTDGDNWVEVEVEGKRGYINNKYADIDIKLISGDTMQAYYEKQEAAVKARVKTLEEETQGSVTMLESYTGGAGDLDLLAAIIYCEAGNQPYEGKVAVGNVVINRVNSAAFPDTIEGVIRSPGQFSPVANGRFDRVLGSGRVPESCYQAAEDAMNGISFVDRCLFFKNPYLAGAHAGITIGDHVFW